jgi:regulator of protease activity HflC (stomatin/prohibitin superfamily)
VNHPYWLPFIVGLLGIPTSIIVLTGFFTLQPNEARVLILFGEYKGTVRESGFHWGNPFYTNGHRLSAQTAAKTAPTEMAAFLSKHPKRNKISLRIRNLNTKNLKVNDKGGNPIEIAAVIVWRVEDTAQAMFDVENYETTSEIQSESALRHLASGYATTTARERDHLAQRRGRSLAGASEGVASASWKKRALVIEEARLSHLAYAPEIAQAMLRRQQAKRSLRLGPRSCMALSAWSRWPCTSSLRRTC